MFLTVLAVEMSIPLRLAVFKSKSAWLIVFVHGVIDNGANYLASNFCMPSDLFCSFGVGIYGLLILGVITLALLKSKEGRKPHNLSAHEVAARERFELSPSVSIFWPAVRLEPVWVLIPWARQNN